MIIRQSPGSHVEHKPPVQPLASAVSDVFLFSGAGEFFQKALTRPSANPKVTVGDVIAVFSEAERFGKNSQIEVSCILIGSDMAGAGRSTIISRRCFL